MKVRLTDNLVSGSDVPMAVAFSAAFERDVRAERQAAFTQFWCSYNTRFYDGGFHGRDWTAIRERYEPLLDSVATCEELALLLNRMVGELEASHSEVGPAPSPNESPRSKLRGIRQVISMAFGLIALNSTKQASRN